MVLRSDLSKLPLPADIASSEVTPPTTMRTKISVDLCNLLPNEAVPEEEKCPHGARVCLKVINEKKGEQDRIVQVITTAAGEENDVETFKWSADLGRKLQGSNRE